MSQGFVVKVQEEDHENNVDEQSLESVSMASLADCNSDSKNNKKK